MGKIASNWCSLYPIEFERNVIFINITTTPTYYPIYYSLSMTNHLVRQGFGIKKVDDSDRGDNLKKFLFHDSPKLRQAMSNFKRQGV